MTNDRLSPARLQRFLGEVSAAVLRYRQRLVVVALLACYTGAVLWVGFVAGHALHDKLVAQRSAHLPRTAASLVQALEAFLYERVSELQRLLHDPRLREGSAADRAAMLQAHVRSSPYLQDARLLGPGDRPDAEIGAAMNAAVRDHARIQEVRRQQEPRLWHAGAGGSPALILGLPVPLADQGGTAVLIGTIPVEAAHAILRQRFTLLASALPVEDWILLDQDGLIVTDHAHRRPLGADLGQQTGLAASRSQSPLGTAGLFQAQDPFTRIAALTGFAQVPRQTLGPGFAWTVLVQASRDAVHAPIDRFLLVLGALYLLAASTLGYLGYRSWAPDGGDGEEGETDARAARGPAYYDSVTGLPGSRLFEMILGQAVARKLPTRRLMALLVFNLKQLKVVTDCQGHARGDLAVRVLTARVKSCVRLSDSVARIGQDRFAVLLENLSAPEDAATVAQKILQTVVLPLRLGDEEILIDTSMGIALYPGDASDAPSLMDRAVQAMSRAAAEGVPIGFHSETVGDQAFEAVLHASTDITSAPSSSPR